MSKFDTFKSELEALLEAHGVYLHVHSSMFVEVRDGSDSLDELADETSETPTAIHHATLIKRVTLDAGAKAVTLKFDSVTDADAYYRETMRRRAL